MAKKRKPKKPNVTPNKKRAGRKSSKTTSRKSTKSTEGKKRPNKSRAKSTAKNDRKRKADRVQKARSRNVKRTKRVQKVSNKVKVSAKAKGRKRSSGNKANRIGKKAPITFRHPRKEQAIELVFTSGQSLERKADTIESDPQIKRVIASQLNRFGGKPPIQFVVIVTDKEGGSAARLSPLEMAVTVDNVIKFTVDFLRELADNYDPDLDGDEIDSGESTHIKNIVSITIKFFYGKTNTGK